MALQRMETLKASSVLPMMPLEDAARAKAAALCLLSQQAPFRAPSHHPTVLHATCTALQQTPQHKHRPFAELFNWAVEQGSASHSGAIGRAT